MRTKLPPPGCAGRPCLSSHAFYRLRRALVDVCAAERRHTRPDSRLADLVPRRRRRTAWRLVAEHSGLPLAGLQPSTALLLAGALVIPLGLAGVFLAQRAGRHDVIPLLFVPGILLSPLMPTGWWLAARLAPAFPADTLRDLVRLTLLRGYGQVAQEGQAGSPQGVSDTIRALVADSMGLTWRDGPDIRLDDTFDSLRLR